jgi:nucleotide-binding universal stress UspA family protein
MLKILCPTDFSEPAINAMGYAAKFAQATNAELILLNVQSIFNLTPNELVRGKGPTLAAINEQLESQCKEISRTFKISCYAEVELSGRSLASVIEQKSLDFDLILMGTNGIADYIEFFTGSDTYKVIKAVSIPVLLIPTECAYSPISSIVYAVDLQTGENFPLRELLHTWAKLLKSRICILQVIQRHHNPEIEKELKRNQLEIKDFYGEEVPLQFDTIWSSEIASSIHSYMLRTESDALALYGKHHGFIEGLFHKSVTKVLSSIARYPVFVFH